MKKYCTNHLKVVTITERSEVEISWLNNNLSHQIVSTKAQGTGNLLFQHLLL
jgi:hypothetical protein